MSVTEIVSLSVIWTTGGGGACTVSVTAVELVLPVKFVSPAYTAVRLWLPDANAEVLNVAVAAPFRVAVPRVVAPSRKVTTSGAVGVPAPGATTVTVAVNVTAWPKVAGFGDAARAVIDVA